MAAASITAPKSGGQMFLAGKPNFMETVIADDPGTRDELAAWMRARGKERRERIWFRDAQAAEAVEAILFVGMLPAWYPPNYDCDACGYATCAEFLNHTETLRRESAELPGTCQRRTRVRRQRMRRTGAAVPFAAAILSACSAAPHHATPAGTRPGTPGPDARTAAALVRIAQDFNNDYDDNNNGPVWEPAELLAPERHMMTTRALTWVGLRDLNLGPLPYQGVGDQAEMEVLAL
jgi:hypothetical protein